MLANQGFFKSVFILLVVAITVCSIPWFSDVNLIGRFFLFSVLSILFILPLKKIELQNDELVLLVFYLFNLISCTWANNFSFAIFETQKTFLYFLSFYMGKKIIQAFGLNYTSKVIMYVALLVLLINGLMFLYNDTSLIGVNTTSAHPNLLSSYLLLCSPFILMQVHYSKLKGRYLPLLILCFLLLVIIGLQTRAVYLGIFIFIVTYVGLELAVKKRRYFHGFVGLLFLGGVSFLAFYLLGGLNIESSSFDERFFAWNKTVKTIVDHPFFGVGSGNWIFNYTHYSIAGFDTFEIYGLIMQRPHNDLLWVIAELGVLGLAIIFIFWAAIFKGLFFAEKTKERTIILAGILSFIPVMLLSFPKERIEHIFLFFLLLAAARVYSKPNKSAGKFKHSKYPIIIISLFSIVLIVFVAKGEYYINKSLQAMKENKPKLVLKNNLQAESIFYTHTNEGIPIASYAAWAHNQLENKMKMVYYSNIAYNQAPNNYEIATNFGMALNTLKKFDDAEKILLWANYLNPRYDGAIFNLAIVYYNKEEYSKAKRWIDKVYYKSEVTDYYSGLIHQKLYKE